MRTKNAFQMIGLAALIIFFSACKTESKTALEKFISEKHKMMVCPVHILTNQEISYDTNASKKIVEYINNKKYAEASVTNLRPPAYNEWKANEAKMLTASIYLFAAFVKSNNIPEDTYILYAEFLRLGPNNRVYAIHYSLLNNKGEVAMRGLINNKWEAFQKVNPETNDDCVAVFINGFEDKMSGE